MVRLTDEVESHSVGALTACAKADDTRLRYITVVVFIDSRLVDVKGRFAMFV